MVSFNKLTRTLAGIAAAALIVPLAACGGSGNGGTATAEGIPAKGTDDGTEITLWTRSPLERQAKNVVEAYNKSHKNQVKLEIIPNDDMEGKVGGASQTDSLPDILAGDVVRIPYWASEGIFTDITKQIDGLDNKADLQQGHIEAGTVDGAEYTLPFITDVSVMVWNKNLYKEAGLDPEQGPKSIDQFVEQAKLPVAFHDRRQEICYKYQLPKGKHKATLKWKNPRPDATFDFTYHLVYSDAPRVDDHARLQAESMNKQPVK